MKRAVILGCGFVGARAARLLACRGWDVTGVTRSRESAARLAGEPFRAIACDIANASNLAAATELHGADAVISAVSSGRRGEETYREVYLNGIRNVIERLNAGRILFVSSTSVYAQNDGSWVTEQSPAQPETPTGRILREAEEMALTHGGLVARLSGIYGPGRSVLLRRFLENRAVIEGDGSRHINQVHADDAARALVHIVTHGLSPAIYNVADDKPMTQLECYGWLAAHLDRPLPPMIGTGSADPNRKRPLTDKRVSNAKLRCLGWALLYPSFPEAVAKDESLLASAREGGSGDGPP
jgi:nucleoside-diphosphate-sugar epimerase